MKTGPPPAVLAGVASWQIRVESWLGGDLLSASVPVAGGVWSVDSSQQVPEGLQGMVVPASAGGVSWIPGEDARHPLARYGQVLDLTIIMGVAGGQATWEIPLGRAAIQSWALDEGQVSVEGAGMLQRAAEERLKTPTGPAPGATIGSEYRRLMPAGIPVDTSALTDRACPASFYWEDDRLGALYELADAWPARTTVTPDGGVKLLTPEPDTFPGAVAAYKDGEGGTTVSATREDSRDGAYNSVVVTSTDESGAPVFPPQEAVVQDGPMIPALYGIVRRFYSSPTITTPAQALSAAQSVLATSLRPRKSVTVTCVPDPRIELYDPVTVVRDGVLYRGYVSAYTLPLVVSGGSMTIQVGLE